MKKVISLIINLVILPATVWIGYFVFPEKKYYFTSFVMILEVLLSFLLLFEKKQIKLSDMITIAVMTSLCAISRVVFYAIPEIKPMMALVIISGIVFGKESGAMVGMLSSFLSNIYFGQGPWTPWQMLATGIIGFLAGMLFSQKEKNQPIWLICAYGFLGVFMIYGGILNFYASLSYTDVVTVETFWGTYLLGIPFDLLHAVSTTVYLAFFTRPMLKKLKRIKEKYGLL